MVGNLPTLVLFIPGWFYHGDVNFVCYGNSQWRPPWLTTIQQRTMNRRIILSHKDKKKVISLPLHELPDFFQCLLFVSKLETMLHTITTVT